MKLGRFLLSIPLFLLLGIASISSADWISRSQVPTDLVEWLIKDISKTQRLSSEVLEDLNKNLKCELHDLNGDGLPEFLLYIDSHFWCGAGTANCNYWVVQKTPKGYKLLLDDKVIRVQDTVTNGYHDLASELTSGCTQELFAKEIHVTIYRYDGKQYRAVRRHVGFRPFQK